VQQISLTKNDYKHHKVHLNALLGTVHTINRKTRQLQKKNIKDNVGVLACSRKMDNKNLTEQGPRLLQHNVAERWTTKI